MYLAGSPDAWDLLWAIPADVVNPSIPPRTSVVRRVAPTLSAETSLHVNGRKPYTQGTKLDAPQLEVFRLDVTTGEKDGIGRFNDASQTESDVGAITQSLQSACATAPAACMPMAEVIACSDILLQSQSRAPAGRLAPRGSISSPPSRSVPSSPERVASSSQKDNGANSTGGGGGPQATGPARHVVGSQPWTVRDRNPGLQVDVPLRDPFKLFNLPPVEHCGGGSGRCLDGAVAAVVSPAVAPSGNHPPAVVAVAPSSTATSGTNPPTEDSDQGQARADVTSPSSRCGTPPQHGAAGTELYPHIDLSLDPDLSPQRNGYGRDAHSAVLVGCHLLAASEAFCPQQEASAAAMTAAGAAQAPDPSPTVVGATGAETWSLESLRRLCRNRDPRLHRTQPPPLPPQQQQEEQHCQGQQRQLHVGQPKAISDGDKVRSHSDEVAQHLRQSATAAVAWPTGTYALGPAGPVAAIGAAVVTKGSGRGEPSVPLQPPSPPPVRRGPKTTTAQLLLRVRSAVAAPPVGRSTVAAIAGSSAAGASAPCTGGPGGSDVAAGANGATATRGRKRTGNGVIQRRAYCSVNNDRRGCVHKAAVYRMHHYGREDDFVKSRCDSDSDFGDGTQPTAAAVVTGARIGCSCVPTSLQLDAVQRALAAATADVRSAGAATAPRRAAWRLPPLRSRFDFRPVRRRGPNLAGMADARARGAAVGEARIRRRAAACQGSQNSRLNQQLMTASGASDASNDDERMSMWLSGGGGGNGGISAGPKRGVTLAAAPGQALRGGSGVSPTLSLLQSLDEWRAHRARNLQKTPEALLRLGLLADVAGHCPTSVLELEDVPGLPRPFIRRFGQEILDICRNHVHLRAAARAAAAQAQVQIRCAADAAAAGGGSGTANAAAVPPPHGSSGDAAGAEAAAGRGGLAGGEDRAAADACGSDWVMDGGLTWKHGGGECAVPRNHVRLSLHLAEAVPHGGNADADLAVQQEQRQRGCPDEVEAGLIAAGDTGEEEGPVGSDHLGGGSAEGAAVDGQVRCPRCRSTCHLTEETAPTPCMRQHVLDTLKLQERLTGEGATQEQQQPSCAATAVAAAAAAPNSHTSSSAHPHGGATTANGSDGSSGSGGCCCDGGGSPPHAGVPTAGPQPHTHAGSGNDDGGCSVNGLGAIDRHLSTEPLQVRTLSAGAIAIPTRTATVAGGADFGVDAGPVAVRPGLRNTCQRRVLTKATAATGRPSDPATAADLPEDGGRFLGSGYVNVDVGANAGINDEAPFGGAAALPGAPQEAATASAAAEPADEGVATSPSATTCKGEKRPVSNNNNDDIERKITTCTGQARKRDLGDSPRAAMAAAKAKAAAGQAGLVPLPEGCRARGGSRLAYAATPLLRGARVKCLLCILAEAGSCHYGAEAPAVRNTRAAADGVAAALVPAVAVALAAAVQSLGRYGGQEHIRQLRALVEAALPAWEVQRVLACRALGPAVQAAAVLRLEPGASRDSVRMAFRRLSLLVHPDKNRSPGAAEAFALVSAAASKLLGSAGPC